MEKLEIEYCWVTKNKKKKQIKVIPKYNTAIFQKNCDTNEIHYRELVA